MSVFECFSFFLDSLSGDAVPEEVDEESFLSPFLNCPFYASLVPEHAQVSVNSRDIWERRGDWWNGNLPSSL